MTLLPLMMPLSSDSGRAGIIRVVGSRTNFTESPLALKSNQLSSREHRNELRASFSSPLSPSNPIFSKQSPLSAPGPAPGPAPAGARGEDGEEGRGASDGRGGDAHGPRSARRHGLAHLRQRDGARRGEPGVAHGAGGEPGGHQRILEGGAFGGAARGAPRRLRVIEDRRAPGESSGSE